MEAHHRHRVQDTKPKDTKNVQLSMFPEIEPEELP